MRDSFEVLDESALPDIVALCRAGLPDEQLRADELHKALFEAHEQPAIVRGDPERGVIATVHSIDYPNQEYVRLLVVHPEHRRRGVGSALLRFAEDELVATGSTTIVVGADAPYWLFPGAPVEQTGLLCLLELHRYQRHEANFNMAVDLTDPALPPDPGGTRLAGPDDRDDVARFCDTQYANWRFEALRALDQGTLVVRRDAGGTLMGFCAYEVNRHGLVGPVAVRHDLVGKGAGRPLLLGALHRLRADGRHAVDIAWVGPIPPYAAVGATVSRVFFVYRKNVGPPP